MKLLNLPLIFIHLFLISLNVSAQEVRWNYHSIKAEVRKDDIGGQHIYMTQTIPAGETGWAMSRFYFPQTWSIKDVEVTPQAVIVHKSNGKDMFITPKNFGSLGFALLDGGKKSDEEIAVIWEKYASN